MEEFDLDCLKQLYIPLANTHKGQNGKLMVIGGSHLFHAASLWSLTVASRIVDMVFYSSVEENNEIVRDLKREFRNGIIVRRDDIESYIEEADCVLIGPGMVRAERETMNQELRNKNLSEINKIKNEGEQTYYLTKYLLDKYSDKKWVIDAGALQMMEPEWLLQLHGNVVLTPHIGEFEMVKLKVKSSKFKVAVKNLKLEEQVKLFAEEFNCIVLLKGHEDVVCSPEECVIVKGGNAGMTKGGTGDVLAGLVAALGCKNELRLSAKAASYINKKAGDSLFEKVGYYFNSTDLAGEIPRVMSELMGL